MNRLHHPRARRRIGAVLTTGLALLVVTTIAPVSANAAFTCTKTISGSHSGVITVAGGQTLCLKGAVQNGAVNVNPGGALSVTAKSIVTGAVTLKSGFVRFQFCDSKTVRGAISATGSRGYVHIGGKDSSGSCAANTIDGAVTVGASNGAVRVADNSIGGAMTARTNVLGTTISANRIVGALTCAGNIPAPINGGASNTVGGKRTGQTCATSTF
jgi:hypothetical protein